MGLRVRQIQEQARDKAFCQQCGLLGSCAWTPQTPQGWGDPAATPQMAHLDKGVSHIQRLLPAEWGGHRLPTGDEGAAGQAVHQVRGVHLVGQHPGTVAAGVRRNPVPLSNQASLRLFPPLSTLLPVAPGPTAKSSPAIK